MAAFNLCVFALMMVSVAADSEFSTDLNKFDAHFYENAIKQTKDNNAIVSGLSAEVVVAMLLDGACGTTKSEIQHALLLKDTKSVDSSFKELIESLNNAKNVELKLANAIFVAPPPSGSLNSIKPTYRALVTDNFKSDIIQVDFSKNLETASYINKWVEDHTNDRIKNLVDPLALSPLTKAIMINAIYFLGNWSKPFDEHATQKETFTRYDGAKVQIDMMYNHDDFLYKKSPELNSQILVLPYKNEDLRMVVILPDKVDGFPALEKKLEGGSNQYLKNLALHDVHVTIPKFKIETTLDVKQIFENLGIKELFEPQANLEHIFFKNGVYISSAIQKAYIEVNERGSEAAVVTALQGVGAYINPNAVFFQADHGFYFAIQYKEITIFSGSFISG